MLQQQVAIQTVLRWGGLLRGQRRLSGDFQLVPDIVSVSSGFGEAEKDQ